MVSNRELSTERRSLKNCTETAERKVLRAPFDLWEEAPGWRSSVIIIALAVAGVFGVAATFGFVNWDDGPNIYRNTNFHPATGAAIVSAWTSARDQFYLPVTYSVWGMLAWISQTFTRTSD